MDIIQELKSKNLLDYIEGQIGDKASHAGSGTYRFKHCPICGKGDHFNVNVNKNLWNTFNNCGGGSIIDFYMSYFGADKQTAIRELCKDFNINFETKGAKDMNKENIKTEVKQVPEQSAKTTKEIDLTSVINNYYTTKENDYTYFLSRLFINDNQEGNFNSLVTKYKFLVDDPKKIFKNNLDLIPGLNNISSYEFIIPVWENNKVVNCILRRNDQKSKDNNKTLNLKSLPLKMLNIEYLENNEKFIFITEGIFDCFSFEMLGKKSICLNSVNMSNKFIELVKQNIETCKNTRFIIALDNDEKGIETSNKIIEELKSLNIENFFLTVPQRYKDINEYYLNDLEGLKDNVNNLFIENEYSYIDTYLKNIDENKNRPIIKTGFDKLDEKLNGGLYPGLYTIGAISSLGKTALTLQIADNIAEMNNNVLFFSLEMPKDELISRSISRHMYLIDSDKARYAGTNNVMYGKTDNCKDIFVNAVELYKENISKHLKIIEGNFDMNIMGIISKVESYINLTKSKPVVFIDYLQIIKPSLEKAYSEKQGVDDVVVKLKMMSRNFKIPVFVISSFNRENYNTSVNFSCFKESGGIEYTSDFVLGLQLSALDDNELLDNKKKLQEYLHKAKDKNPREITLVILKNRNGKSFTKQKFNFYAKNNLFVEGDMLCL